MGKNNVNKRFTVDLEISTGDAEKQVKASAENIKKILSSAIEDGIGTKELRKMAETINAMFTGLGKTAPLNIDENFTGKGKTAERVKILSNELNNLFDILGKINTMSSTSGNMLGGVSNEAQAEIDKLEGQSRRYQSIIDTFNQVSKMKIAWDDGDKIELDIDATEESAKKLIDRFNQLNDVINEGNLDDIAYADALVNRAKAALQLIEINERLTKTNKNGEVIKESPKFLRDFLAMNDDGESLSQYALEDFEYEAPEIISKLKNSVSEVTQQMENLRNTTETALSGVDSIAKGSSIGNKVDDIGKAAESSKEKVDALKNSIKEVFMSSAQIEVDTRSGKLNGNETMSLFEANGNVSTVQGTDYQVDTDALVQQTIANLNKNIVMSLHNHANGDMTFSPSDINSFAKLYYGQGTKINGIIANGVIQTIDFNNISQEVAVKIAQDYQEGVKHFFDSELVSQFASLQSGEIIPTDMLKRLQINDPKQYQEVINTIQEGTMATLRQAFENNGAEFALQSFDVDNIEKLTEYLHKAQQSAQGTIEPVEKLKNLITILNPNKTFDWNQFTDIFEKFKSGAIDGTQAFNQILDFKTVAADVGIVTTSINQAESKLKEFLALTDEIHNKSFSDAFDATDNVEIGKYTERLNSAKAALDELGDQGQLTAEQLEQVNNAFDVATRDLQTKTHTYDGYVSGYSSAYDYYDEYQDELEKKESLQAENEQLRAQLADQEANRQEAQDHTYLQETIALLEKEKLTYEDVLALVRAYNDETKSKAAATSGDWDEYDKIFQTQTDIARKLVPISMTGMGSDSPDKWLSMVGISAEEAAQKLYELYNRWNAFDDLVDAESSASDDLDAENASLERKLELLRDIAEQYGNSITQKDRNIYEKLSDKEMESGLTSKEEDRYSELGEKISEADEQLEQFGETYDKILLKLANGKTIEILPEDAGLRKFDRIANEFYQGEYNGFEIEDVIFMRKQEQSVIEQNNQELQKQLDIQEQIATAQKETPESQQAETIANNAKAITSWEELCQVVERYNELVLKAKTEGQALTNEDEAELSRIDDRFAATKGVADDPDKFVDYAMAMSRMSGLLGEYNSNRLAEYFGIEIPQATAKATDAIQEVAQATEDLSTPPDTSASTAKYEAETQVIKQQNDELERNQQLKVQEGTLDTNSSVVGDMSQESKQLDELHSKLIAVKEAVDAKTQAFEEEYVTVDTAVNAEVQSLQLLLQQLQDVLNTIGLINQAFTQANESIARLYGTKDIDIKEDAASNAAVEKSKEIINKQYALDSTVASTNKILGDILAAINKEKDPGVQKELGTLISALTANINALKDATNGVIDHQKAQKTDTTKAMARIQDPAQFKQISSIAENSIGDLGTDVHIKSLKALANGLVGVEGAFKDVNGEWEGFTVRVNESNNAVDLAINKQSAFAKVMRKLDEEMEKMAKASADANDRKLPPEATATSAIIKAQDYDDDGKEVTVQYKDSQRYTVSLKENIGGLQKEVFQTFDDSIEDFNERTTVTISNKTAAAIRDTNKLISENTKDVGNANLLREYNAEYGKLLQMNQRYRSMDDLGDDDIDTWNSQITLVQNLGNQITGLIKQQQRLENEKGVATSAKRLQEYQSNADKIFRELDFGLNEAKTPAQNQIVGIYDQIIEKVNALKKSHSVLTDQQTQEINTLIDSLKKEADAYKSTIDSVFKSDRDKKLSKFDLDKATLEKDINTSSFSDEINNARNAIANAANADSLKIAINGWEELQNKIKAAAIQQDLYYKKAKDTDTKPDKFTKDLDKQKTNFAQYKQEVENATGVTDELKGKLVELENQLNSVGDADGLAKWAKSFKNVANEIKSKRAETATAVVKWANNRFRELDFKADANDLTWEQKVIVEKHKELLQYINEYNDQVSNGQKDKISNIEDINRTMNALSELIEKYKTKYKIENAGGSTTKKAYGTAQLQNFTGKYNFLMNRAGSVGLNSDVEAVQKLTNAYQHLQDVQAKFKVGEDTKSGVGAQKAEEFKQAQFECNRYAQELAKVIVAEEKLRADSESSGGKSAPVAEDFDVSIKGRAQALEDFVRAQYGASASIGKFNTDMTKLSFVVKNGDGTITNMTASLNAARTAIYATAGGTEKATTSFGRFFDELKAKARGITTYLISMTGFQEIWQQVRQGVQYVREIDSALTELKKVTDETDATYKKFLGTMSSVAGAVGSTTSELTQSAADWARLGYSIEQAGELAKNTAILMNVSEFDNVNDATEALISSLQAFGYEASNSIEIVDKLNIVGKYYCL